MSLNNIFFINSSLLKLLLSLVISFIYFFILNFSKTSLHVFSRSWYFVKHVNFKALLIHLLISARNGERDDNTARTKLFVEIAW